MTRTNTQIVLTSLAALGLLAAGCDIFPSQPGGNPAIVRVLAVDQLALSTPPEVNAADGAGNWILGQPAVSAGVDASNVNSPGPVGHASRYQIVDVQFNKVMNGDSIQTAVNDCTPVAGSISVTTTPAQPGGTTCGDANQSQISCFTTNWFTCYVPQTSDPSIGSQVMVFQLPDGQAYDPTATPAGQGAGLLPGFTYTVTGTVKDYAGTALDIKSTVTTQTAPMITGATTTQVDVSWHLTSDVTSFTLQRAPDDGTGAPGAFADVAPAAGASPYADSGLTPGTIYWYRMVLNPGAVTSGMTNATTLPLTVAISSTDATVAGQVTVNWPAAVAGDGIDTFNVQRAKDAATLSYSTIKSGLTNTTATYVDKTVAAATIYHYRIVSVAADGVLDKGPATTVTVP